MKSTSYWIAKIISNICIVIIILYVIAKLFGISLGKGAFTDAVFTIGTDLLKSILNMPIEYAYHYDFSNPSYMSLFVFIFIIPALIISKRFLRRHS